VQEESRAANTIVLETRCRINIPVPSLPRKMMQSGDPTVRDELKLMAAIYLAREK
jgi:hypothetical protein